MAINVHCFKCKSSSKLGTRVCKKCKTRFTEGNRKYRVSVKLPNGTRRSKLVDSLEVARKVEAKFKSESVTGAADGPKTENVRLTEIWSQYLEWAKINKKSWNDDQDRWTHHVEPCLKSKSMGEITPRDIEVVLERMLGWNNHRGNE